MMPTSLMGRGRTLGVVILRSPMRVVYVTLMAMLAFGVGWLILIPPVLGRASQTKPVKVKCDLSVLVEAVQQFKADMGRYPTDEEGLSGLKDVAVPERKRWRGPYLKQDLSKDPWGNPYLYTVMDTDAGEKFQVMSYGADAMPGGVGDDADLVDGTLEEQSG